MTITYKTNSIGLTVPVLHRVVYDRIVDVGLACYQRSYKDYLVDEWLKKNCRYPYYHSPGWDPVKSIQFECDKEATLFALRWS